MATNAVKLEPTPPVNIYERLNAAREQFHSLQLKKTGKNTFAGYQYFELGDFLIPALRVFHENGLCAMISFDQHIARMRIVSVEDGGEIEITSPMGSAALKGCHEVQNIGAVETYQRRYLWVAALEIVEHDALDATTGRDAPDRGNVTPMPPRQPATPARQRPEPLTGPMKTRAEARARYGEIVRELHACGDSDQLHAFLESISLELDQFRDELPNAWNGDGADFIGLKAEVANAHSRFDTTNAG